MYKFITFLNLSLTLISLLCGLKLIPLFNNEMKLTFDKTDYATTLESLFLISIIIFLFNDRMTHL